MKRVTSRQRRAVAKRANSCCEYCRSQESYSPQTLAVEHIIPLYRGGETELDNLAYSCQGCNNHKFTKIEARDPRSNEVVPLFHPRQQRWNDHFTWSEDATMIIGLTPTGRATIEALKLNRANLINFRRVLRAVGKHPPVEPIQE